MLTLRMMRHDALTKRQLLKETRLAWLDAGYVVKRGTTMRPISEVEAILKTLPDILRVYQGADLKGQNQMQAATALLQQCMG